MATVGERQSDDADAIQRMVGLVAAWYQAHHERGVAGDWRAVPTDDGGYWFSFRLDATPMSGLVIESFVVDLGALGWVQGWADGESLTLAASERLLATVANWVASSFVPGASGAT